ncbi:hypothetical protein [Streptomyces sp. DH24]|uniref:hypothetical protein n=1 Tax=Streptomyces sp. DH24 TaxID=3040123 RepID=UPI0024418434|nr:hypothetical protein [Streptomyces sp. DH24]MDG9717312.1 hypothetical protein [Streptomyces sp. DH24]
MPDQQAGTGEDPWDVPDERPDDTAADEQETSSGDVPDTDEAGTGREGAPHQSGTDPEQPVPDESSA